MNIGRILIIVGFVLIGIGILIMIFLPDTSRGTTSVSIVNAYGAFLLIIGLVVFLVRRIIVAKTTGFEEIASKLEDVKKKKGKSKLKAIIILVGIIAIILFFSF